MNESTVICALIGFLILFYGSAFLYFRFGLFHRWYHNVLKWHQPDDTPKWSDGCSAHARCKWCGKEIMQDSQGNWF